MVMYLLNESMNTDPSGLRNRYSALPVVQARSPLNVERDTVGVQERVSAGVHPAQAMPTTSSSPQKTGPATAEPSVATYAVNATVYPCATDRSAKFRSTMRAEAAFQRAGAQCAVPRSPGSKIARPGGGSVGCAELLFHMVAST